MRLNTVRAVGSFVLVVGVGLAALRHANEAWVGSLLLILLFSLCFCMLKIIYEIKINKAPWVGYAIFNSSYLIFVFGPWFSDNIQPKFPTTKFLILASDYLIEHSHSLQDLYTARQRAKRDLNIEMLRGRKDKANVVLLTKKVELLNSRITSIQGFPPIDDPLQRAIRIPQTAPKSTFFRFFYTDNLDQSAFVHVGHCAFALLAGILGALVSSRTYTKSVMRSQITPP